MKLSNNTLRIIKNFSSIYNQLKLTPGNTINSCHEVEDIYMQAVVEETFPVTAPIYDVNKFLSIVSLLEDPDFDFQDKQIVLRSGRQTLTYTYAAESMVKSPDRVPKDLKKFLSFKLSSVEMEQTLKAMSVLGQSEIAIVGNGSIITIEGSNRNRGKSDNNYLLNIGDTSEKFRIVVALERLKLLPRDYEVSIANSLVEFKSEGLTYWAAMHGDTDYGTLI